MKGKKEVVVLATGCWDPLHLGHIKHLEAASRLGTKLIVAVAGDEVVIAKKGYCLMPLEDRMAVVQGLKWVSEVLISVGTERSDARTLEVVHPHILAKGGDKAPENMFPDEIATCQQIGCKIVYGVGGEKIRSSSALVQKVRGGG